MALACDYAVLRTLTPPVPVDAEPVVVSGAARTGDQPLSGAMVVMDSAWSVSDWARVLFRPEDHDLWSPPEIGVKRAERIDATHVWQTLEIPILWGAVKIRRQTITEILWKDRGARLENCWQARPHAPFAARVAAWEVPDVAWQELGLGSWVIEPRPDGGSRAAYQFWTQPDLVPAKVQAWGMSKTLPTLIRSFDARVGDLARHAR